MEPSESTYLFNLSLLAVTFAAVSVLSLFEAAQRASGR
jgi:hypothetical protein